MPFDQKRLPDQAFAEDSEIRASVEGFFAARRALELNEKKASMRSERERLLARVNSPLAKVVSKDDLRSLYHAYRDKYDLDKFVFINLAIGNFRSFKEQIARENLRGVAPGDVDDLVFEKAVSAAWYGVFEFRNIREAAS